jgi:YHS domain-containing protein
MFLLWAVFLLVVFHAIRRVFRGIAEGVSGRASSGGGRRPAGSRAPATKGELMIRDPVCGTYVVPSRALSARGADGTVYFCSDKCRQTYVSR